MTFQNQQISQDACPWYQHDRVSLQGAAPNIWPYVRDWGKFGHFGILWMSWKKKVKLHNFGWSKIRTKDCHIKQNIVRMVQWVKRENSEHTFSVVVIEAFWNERDIMIIHFAKVLLIFRPIFIACKSFIPDIKYVFSLKNDY